MSRLRQPNFTQLARARCPFHENARSSAAPNGLAFIWRPHERCNAVLGGPGVRDTRFLPD